MKQKSSTLLATTFRHKYLETFCIGNYKYISYKNNFTYNFKKIYNISEILSNTEYSIILFINHYSIFLTAQLDNLLNCFNSQTHILLPTQINAPIEATPICIKNSIWSKQFLELYMHSNLYNLQSFITKYNFQDSSNIKYTDQISISNNTNAIIRYYINNDIKYIKENMILVNSNLGIL